jgi:hypothetical protein
VEHAAKTVKMSSNSATINQFIINTICSDGKVILDDEAMAQRARTEVVGMGGATGGSGATTVQQILINNQVGIVLELANLQNLKDSSLTEDPRKLEEARD